ncbi:MAG: helix-turn-helix transcriptional regulator [Candidatus Aenigmarchaeota archaeon]|nr:helix-turn-helix transcriptional regulator [Candidatus Aenigmarchaeota archaeon]
MASPAERLAALNTTDCLWIYILRILRDQDMHAYAVRNEIEKRFGFRSGIMTAYKVLYLLHRDGYVRKATRGRRKVYAITPSGRAELRKAATFYRGLEKKLR